MSSAEIPYCWCLQPPGVPISTTLHPHSFTHAFSLLVWDFLWELWHCYTFLGLPDFSSRVYGNLHNHMAFAYCMPTNVMPHADMRLNSSYGLLLDCFCTSCFPGWSVWAWCPGHISSWKSFKRVWCWTLSGWGLLNSWNTIKTFFLLFQYKNLGIYLLSTYLPIFYLLSLDSITHVYDEF